MRVDVFLVENGYCKSRQFAKGLILDNRLLINHMVCNKPSYNVKPTDSIQIVGNEPKYVGRGGLKLETAIKSFNIALKDNVCIDIGASTGGFTDCMLQNGASKVYALDVGHDQLDSTLLKDSRVINLEKTNIRDVELSIFNGDSIDFISVDVSFISLKLVLPKVYELLKPLGSAITLIKPQFEAGKNNLNKNGIVKSEKVRQNVVNDVQAFAQSLGFTILGVCQSAITGSKGNVEYLMYVIKR
ncbi:MAG: TlyA family RNA methyltransferase [Ruminococcus sp.]|nr:TlyA family RNA methyltransferase [Ruminococcus sp.]